MTSARAQELIRFHAEMRKTAYAHVLPQVVHAFTEARRHYGEKTAAETSWPPALELHLVTP